MKARFVRKTKEAENIFTFWFEPAQPLDQLAGQYIEMTLRHEQPDERGTKRWFTLSNAPTDAPLASITTKFASEHGSSFKQSLRSLKPGDEVLISAPMGDFVLPKNASIPLVFVAGGIGITPFHSIVKWLLDTKQRRDITFLYAVASENELAFQKLFEHSDMPRHLIIGQRLTAQRIMELVKPADDALIYTSGPEQMVETLQKDLQKSGIKKSQLLGDFFPGYSKV